MTFSFRSAPKARTLDRVEARLIGASVERAARQRRFWAACLVPPATGLGAAVVTASWTVAIVSALPVAAILGLSWWYALWCVPGSPAATVDLRQPLREVEGQWGRQGTKANAAHTLEGTVVAVPTHWPRPVGITRALVYLPFSQTTSGGRSYRLAVPHVVAMEPVEPTGWMATSSRALSDDVTSGRRQAHLIRFSTAVHRTRP